MKKPRAKSAHPWRTATQISRTTPLPKRPSAVQYEDQWWLCSPDSFLRLRRLGPNQKGWYKNSRVQQITNADQFQSFFSAWLPNHLITTLEKKVSALGLQSKDRCLRWIFSENDLIPGLIVDIFGSTVIAQINSAPIEVFWLPLKSALAEAYHQVFQEPCQIIEMRNSSIRKKENLEIILNENLTSRLLFWNNFDWHMTPGSTQKTGAYFDQRLNHLHTAKLAKENKYRKAWDLCCYQGGFSIHLLKEGLSVFALDQSDFALEIANKNVQVNKLDTNSFTTSNEDVFTWLKKQIENLDSLEERPDLIVLDPPSFVKNRENIEPALRGLIKLNELSLRCLKPGGTLVSCVCSHHISIADYEKVLQKAAENAGRSIVSAEMFGPSPDHLPVQDFAEGRYLQAWFLLIE